MLVYANALVKDEGTILILQGTNDRNDVILFAADRRLGLDIVDALHGADLVKVEVPTSMIVMRMVA